MLIDAVFAILVFFACIRGFRKGLILSLFSVTGFIIGLVAALKLSAIVANKLSSYATVSGKWLPALSFFLVFITVVILVNMGARLIEKTAEMVLLGWANKLGGACLYLLLYSIVFSAFLFYAVQLKLISIETTGASVIYPYLHPLAPKVINTIGVVIPFLKGIFGQLEVFFDAVSNKIQH
jgi:membrane protein required for colicin V production